MSNDELQAAIAYCSQRLRDIAPDERQYIEFNMHLKMLLEEQMRRAVTPQPGAEK
jgi:hypothetical protein